MRFISILLPLIMKVFFETDYVMYVVLIMCVCEIKSLLLVLVLINLLDKEKGYYF